MKKVLCILLVSMLFILSGCSDAKKVSTKENKESQTDAADIAENEEKPMNGVFRYANWGDSMETVEEREVEKLELKEEDGLMYGNIKLLTYNVDAFYFFEDNKFKEGFYDITDTHTNENKYIDDFKNINEVLIEKYGEPLVNEEKWIRDILKSDPGLAMYYGDVTYRTLWEFDNLTIFHMLYSDNFKISHGIFYSNPNDPEKKNTSGL